MNTRGGRIIIIHKSSGLHTFSPTLVISDSSFCSILSLSWGPCSKYRARLYREGESKVSCGVWIM